MTGGTVGYLVDADCTLDISQYQQGTGWGEHTYWVWARFDFLRACWAALETQAGDRGNRRATP